MRRLTEVLTLFHSTIRGAPQSISGDHVTSMRTQVEETIEAIRPALQADGGDIELKDVDEATGIVSVLLVGACGTCPTSTQTLKQGIERIMRDRVDGVTEVVNVGTVAP
jgi:Fe-S cluster biogenesis protein NfuA